MTLSLPTVDAKNVGALLALFERAVGFYASFVNINAYHQPGVEAGKKAAGSVLETQVRILETLKGSSEPLSVEELAKRLNMQGDEDIIFAIVRHLAGNKRIKVQAGVAVTEDRYSF
jgi:glucose-6-phosphate isomerase